jgi:hypothetical protein
MRLNRSGTFVARALAAVLVFSVPAMAEAGHGKQKKLHKPALLPHSLLPDIYPLDMPRPSAVPAVKPPVSTTGGAAQPSGAKDACAAYLALRETYAVCQDQAMKIQRLIDARARRAGEVHAPPGKTIRNTVKQERTKI